MNYPQSILRPGCKIAIALSGGVDSSVVAYWMKHFYKNHSLVCVHMSNWETLDEDDPYCTKDQDWKDAQAVAAHLQLPIHPTSFVADYWTQVFEPFTAGVERGIRPNPDIDCNRTIKFGVLKDYVQSKLGAEGLATGHYARLWYRDDNANQPTKNIQLVEELLEQDTRHAWIRNWGGTNSATLSPLLLAARDRSKCQSFFLSGVSGAAFHNVLFPLGDLLKKPSTTNTTTDSLSQMSVRDIAQYANLPTAHKKDSMGICFIGKRPGGFQSFIHQYFSHHHNSDEYSFVDVDTGAIVANDQGNATSPHTMVYTRGQRARISGAKDAWFVTHVCPDTRTIFVCAGTHHPALYTNTFYLQDVNWGAGDVPTPLKAGTTVSLSSSTTATTNATTLHAKCRIRNLQPLVDCRVTYNGDSSKENRFRIETEKPLRAVTPGQHCAIYIGDDGLVCLGGGTIVDPGPSFGELGLDLDLNNLHPAGNNDWSVVRSSVQKKATKKS